MLGAELVGGIGDELWTADGGGVDGDVGDAGVEEGEHIVEGSDAAADGEGYGGLLDGSFDGVEEGLSSLVGCGDVEEDEFVGASLGVGVGGFGGVAEFAEVDEVDAFDESAVFGVEAGDDSAIVHVVLLRVRILPGNERRAGLAFEVVMGGRGVSGRELDVFDGCRGFGGQVVDAAIDVWDAGDAL